MFAFKKCPDIKIPLHPVVHPLTFKTRGSQRPVVLTVDKSCGIVAKQDCVKGSLESNEFL